MNRFTAGSRDQQLQGRGLCQALRNHDWAAFAHGYNGAGYAKNEYDKKLAAAYQHMSTHGLPDASVREGQLLLTFLGFNPGTVDGALGSHTREALHRFQSQHQLPTTSGFDPATLEALRQQHARLPRSEAAPCVTVLAPPQVSEVPPPVSSLATRPSSVPSTPVPEPVTRAPVAPTVPAPLEVLAVVDGSPVPARLSGPLHQRLAQPLGEEVQDELASLLVLRTKAAQELGPSALESIDLGITALTAEQPNLVFVRGIRKRISAELNDQLYPLRPPAILRSDSPATQAVFGLGLLLLATYAVSAVTYLALTHEGAQVLGIPIRSLVLMVETILRKRGISIAANTIVLSLRAAARSSRFECFARGAMAAGAPRVQASGRPSARIS